MRPKNRLTRLLWLLLALGCAGLPALSYSDDSQQTTKQIDSDDSDRGCSPVVNQITW